MRRGFREIKEVKEIKKEESIFPDFFKQIKPTTNMTVNEAQSFIDGLFEDSERETVELPHVIGI